MPADGGLILPHTDTPQKAVTLIFSMLRPGEWNPAFGGGTDVLKPKPAGLARIERIQATTNKVPDYSILLSDFEIAHTYEYLPNQCVIFIKNVISWHSVGPMKGKGSSLMRRTLTLNIERVN